MKQRFLLILILILTISFTSSSQRTIIAKLVDKETGNPIKDAMVLLLGTQIKTTTNYMGFFTLNIDSLKTLEITCADYDDLVIMVPDVDRFKVEMQKFDKTKYENMGTVAEFSGGTAAFYKYIKTNIKKPREVKWGRISGKVIVKFEIDSTGNIPADKIKVTKSLSEACDKEAVRLIKESPKWIPATAEGNNTNSTMHLPIDFE